MASQERIASNRFRAFTYRDFKVAMDRLGLVETQLGGVSEFVFERFTGGDEPERYSVRVFSTVLLTTGLARERGDHSIRVCLYDHAAKERVREWRVYRTGRALMIVKQRVRLALDLMGVPMPPSVPIVFGEQLDLFRVA